MNTFKLCAIGCLAAIIAGCDSDRDTNPSLSDGLNFDIDTRRIGTLNAAPSDLRLDYDFTINGETRSNGSQLGSEGAPLVVDAKVNDILRYDLTWNYTPQGVIYAQSTGTLTLRSSQTISPTYNTAFDSDGDGYTNYVEIARGTDPTNASIFPIDDVNASQPSYSNLSPANGTVVQQAADNNYQFRFSTSDDRLVNEYRVSVLADGASTGSTAVQTNRSATGDSYTVTRNLALQPNVQYRWAVFAHDAQGNELVGDGRRSDYQDFTIQNSDVGSVRFLLNIAPGHFFDSDTNDTHPLSRAMRTRNDTFDTAQQVNGGGEIFGYANRDTDEFDYFFIDGSGSGQIRLEPIRNGADLDLQVYDQFQNLIDGSSASGNDFDGTPADDSAQITLPAFVRVNAFSNSGAFGSRYKLSTDFGANNPSNSSIRLRVTLRDPSSDAIYWEYSPAFTIEQNQRADIRIDSIPVGTYAFVIKSNLDSQDDPDSDPDDFGIHQRGTVQIRAGTTPSFSILLDNNVNN